MRKNIPLDLILSKLRQNMSEGDEILFNEWLDTGNNLQLFLQFEIVWENVQKKSAGYEPDVEYNWQKLVSKIKLGNPEKKSPKKVFFRYFTRIAAAASIIFVISFLFIHYYKEHNSVQQSITYSTQKNRSTVYLPDNSEIILHANTVLSYNMNEESGQREVSITGEAYFKVKHNDNIPFVVNTNGVSIKVHGTEFNVCSYSSADKIVVSLVEGSISMSTSDKNIFLKPGEEALYNKADRTLSVTEGDMELAKIWTGDKIRFENKSLNEVCRYLSKWYGVHIKIDPNIIGNQSYTFTVMGQPLTEIIEIMASINSFDYYFTSENELILKQKNKTAYVK